MNSHYNSVPSCKKNGEQKYKTLLLNIDSKFRKNLAATSSNDFTFELPYKISNVVSMQFKSIELINSVYTINSKKAQDHFFINNTKIVVPAGNYSHSDIETKINSILPANFVFVIDLISGKTIIKNSLNQTFTLTFAQTSNKYYDTLGYLLGFRKIKYENNASYTSESIFNINGDTYFFLLIDDFLQSNTFDNIVTVVDKNCLSSNILARIPNIAGTYNILYEDSSDNINKIRHYCGPVNLSRLRIKLLASDGSLLDNNNTDYSFVLEIKQLIVFEQTKKNRY